MHKLDIPIKLLQTCILVLLLSQITSCQTVDEPKKEELLSRAAVTSVSNLDGFTGTSYSWFDKATQFYSNPKLGDPTLQGILQDAISDVMTEKGYTFKQNSWESDVFVGYVVALESSLSSEEIAEIYGVNPGLPELSNDLNKFEKGTLIVHAFDSKLGTLLWRGAIQAEVQFDSEPNVRRKRSQAAVNSLLHSFPSAVVK